MAKGKGFQVRLPNKMAPPRVREGYLTLQREARPVWAAGRKADPIHLTVPADGWLRGSLATGSDVGLQGMVRVLEETEVEPAPLLVETSVSADRAWSWSDWGVDLSAWAGRSVRILLETRRPDLAYWSSPRVCSEQAAGEGILVVVIDTLRADAVGAYGGGLTPHFDRASRRGRLYSAARSTASWTLPSVASIMTGRMPHEVGGMRTPPRIHFSAPRLARSLEEQRWWSWGISANPTVGADSGVAVGFSRFHTFERNPTDGGTVTDLALSYLREAGSHPVFLYVQYMDPHDPYDPELPGPVVQEIKRAADEGRLGPVSDEDAELLQRRYQSDVESVDGHLARLLAVARRRGFRIVLTSDHGEEFFEHGWVAHGQTLFEEQVRVPLVLEGPSIEPGRVDWPVSLRSLPGTVAFWAGAPAFGPRLDDAPEAVQMAEVQSYVGAGHGLKRLRAAWDGRFKLVSDLDRQTLQGFDLVADPAEQSEVTLPDEVFEALRPRVDPWPEEATRIEPSPSDDELVETLQALGYLQ